MRSRSTAVIASLALIVCFVCQVAEIFDQWDNTLQTGDDTEYALVVLALCVGIAYSLKWILPEITLPVLRTEVISSARDESHSRPSIYLSVDFPLAASPPAAALRI